jgi:hypothetical protein
MEQVALIEDYQVAVFEALAKSAQTIQHGVRGPAVEEADHWHRRLLCACRERPHNSRAAENGDEVAALHVAHLPRQLA